MIGCERDLKGARVRLRRTVRSAQARVGTRQNAIAFGGEREKSRRARSESQPHGWLFGLTNPVSRDNFLVYHNYMRYRFTTIITQEDQWFVARAVELGVVSQGKSVEEAENNLKEAVELYLENEKVLDKISSDHAPIVTSLEVEYA
jgi:predicted RNase H-like HicB family nuclease